MAPLFAKDIKRSKGLSCVSFNPDGIAFAHIESATNEKVKLKCCDFLPCADFKQRAIVLAKYVKKHRLENANCACVLKPSDYRLLLLDSPNVPKEELKQAAKFLVKDLIDFPINEAAMDIFEIPLLEPPKIYTVVTRLTFAKQLSDVIEVAGLNLQYMDISELALRNLASVYPNIPDDVALLFMGSACVHTVVELIHDKMIYLIRRMGVTSNVLPDGTAPLSEDDSQFTAGDINADELVHELQNSFDYYQNRMGQTLPSKILVTPMPTEIPDVLKTISSSLSIPVEMLDLNTVIDYHQPLDATLQARCLTLIGEGFRLSEQLTEKSADKTKKQGTEYVAGS